MVLSLVDITVEGLDRERPLQTGEVVIIVVVLLMWAGEYRMGSQGLGSMIVGSGEGYPSGEKGEKRSGGGKRLVEGGNQDKFGEKERRLLQGQG